MEYLAFPVLAFFAIAAMIYRYWERQTPPRRYTGRLSHLNLISSVVGTASFGPKRFSCSVARRVTRLDVVFVDKAIHIELPILTASQRKNTQRLLAAFSQLNRPRLEESEGVTETKIVGDYEGSKDELPDAISKLYQAVFDVDPKRPVAFEIAVTADDHRQIVEHWDDFSGEEAAQQNETPVSKRTPEVTSAHRNGCIIDAAALFLLPIPFIAAYYLFNIQIAAIVLFATSASKTLHSIYKRGLKDPRGISVYGSFVTPLGALAAIVLDETAYLQMVPSVVCLFLGIAAFVGVVIGRSTHTPKSGRKDHLNFSKLEHRLVSAVALAICAVGYSVNEYLRHQAELTAWVWYFSYLRLELALGYSIAITPVLTSSIGRQRRSDI